MASDPTSLLIFRNGSIGNTLAAVPAMRALRAGFPRARLTVVVDPVGYTLLKHFPWFDRLIVYDKRGKDRGLLAHINLIRDLRSVRPSHAVLFKRFFRNGLLSLLSGAPIRAGFVSDGKAPFLNLTIPYDSNCPIVDLNLRLAETIGAPSAGRHLEMFLSAEDHRDAERILKQHSLIDTPFAIAHYGGLTTPPDFVSIPQFAEVVQRSVQDMPVLVIGHGTQETHWAASLGQIPGRFLPTCGIPLRTTAALLSRARFFLGFNSGPAHLAAAMKTPSIILFRGDANSEHEIRKWLPPSNASRALIPPRPAESAAWNSFLDTIQETADRLRNNRSDHANL
jgi:heptosyltransferase-2